MKKINYIIVLLASLLLAWGLPVLYHMMTDEATGNIFTYYSSVENEFCTIDYDYVKEELIRKSVKTEKEYNEAQFDSILPMFYYHQLLSDGRFPDTINGKAITPREIGSKTFYFSVKAQDKNKPHIPIYTLMESMSGRVNLETPGDFFRLNKNGIEFIDPEINAVKQEKSEQFMAAFERVGFTFPAKLVAGNPTTMKAYDEGYFICDDKNHIYHLKMVNNKPFIKDVDFPSEVNPVYISTMEPDDKSFYAFVFDENNNVYLVTTDRYKVIQIPTPKYDIDKDRLLIMANPLYWNVNIMSDRGKEVYAIDANTKELVDKVSFFHDDKPDVLASLLFPFQIRMAKHTSMYVKPSIKFGAISSIIVNLFFAVLYFFICKRKKYKKDIFPMVCVLLTGVYGFIAGLVFIRK